MEKVNVWYLTDHAAGKKIAGSIKNMGVLVNIVHGQDLKKEEIPDNEINVIIADNLNSDPGKTVKSFEADQRIQSCLKFLILGKNEIKELSKQSYNTMHLEFISRDIGKREFLLLIEKSILVERYREIMKFIAKEAESRIETYEGLMDISRKHVFESENEKKAFEKILHYEKNLITEQSRLARMISKLSMLRQKDIFDMQKRIDAEDMLGDLRRKELFDAREVIDAQESVLDYTVNELESAKTIINASEHAAELSRSEAMELHNQLNLERELNKQLSTEIENLLKEISELKAATH